MTSTPRDHLNPYAGPRAFRYGERLYGRDQEVVDLLDLVIAERIVLLYSPSGAGKTSLIQAALIPELEAEGFRVLPVIRVSQEPSPGLQREPGINRYLLSALLSLEETLPEEGQTPLAELATVEFGLYLNRWRATSEEPNSAVLIFDQFEEILTMDPTDRREKIEFFEQVGAALRDRQRWALFALREDYLAGLDPFLHLVPTRFGTTFRLELLGEAAARKAVQEPSRQAGVDFPDGAATTLINDLRRVRVQGPEGTTEQLGPYVEPVQLQVVCRRLWEGLPAGAAQIKESDIQAVGDVDNALADYYADRVAAIAAQTGISERAIRDWCDHQLITGQGIRRQVLQEPEQSQGLDNRAISLLVDAHLMRSERRRDATWFELAHDRLIEPMRTDNAAWYEANLSPMQRQADLWESQGRQSGRLLRDQALEEAECWAEAHPDDLTPIEYDFLSACQEAREIDRRERRQARRIRWLAIGAVIVSIIAVAAFLVAYRQLRLSRSRELAAAAMNNLDVDPERSILLAMQAMSVAHTIQAEDALHKAIQASRVRLTLAGHDDEVTSVAYSPDGRRLATGSRDGTAKVWLLRGATDFDGNVTPSRELLTLEGHSDHVSSVAFNRDGSRLATASWDGTARVWDAKTGEPLLTLSDNTERVYSIAFSPDGARLATANVDGMAKVWDAKTGQLVRTLSGHTDRVYRVAYSPDGRRLATGSWDKTAKVWDAASGAELSSLSGHDDVVVAVAFSPDGTRLATASRDNTAKVWDATSGKLLLTLAEHTAWVEGVAFSPDGKRLGTASWDRMARVWDATTGDELFTLAGHGAAVLDLAFSPDGRRLATASADSTARVWNVAGSEELLTLSGHTDRVSGVAFSSECSSPLTRRTVLITGRSEQAPQEQCRTRLVSASWDGMVKVWSLPEGLNAAEEFLYHTPSHILPGHYDKIRGLAISQDGMHLATASDDRSAKVWQLSSGAGSAGNTPAPFELLTIRGHKVPVLRVAFSSDGRHLATSSSDGTAKVWNAVTGELLLTLSGHTDSVMGVDFSPDGARLATTSADQTAKIWDATSGQELLTLSGHGAGLRGIDFSPDGVRLATSSEEGTAKVWDSTTGRELLTLSGHTGPVLCVAFSPDGGRMVTSGTDGTTKVWDSTSGDELLSFSGHDGPVTHIAFGPDGKHLATSGADMTVRLYVLDITDLMALARTRVTRAWRPDECHKYLHRDRCPSVP